MTALVIEKRDPLDLSMIRGFVGDDAAEVLDDALELLLNGAPLFTCMGDLRIEGDVSSKDLLAHCGAGFEAPAGKPPESNFTVFVRGSLEVTGVLKVLQYHDVYLRDSLRARSILSHTGNLVVKGPIVADDVVAFTCNEEGGLLHAASCDVPLLCHLGDGGDWAVANATGKKTIHGADFSDPDFEALLEALARLGVKALPQYAFSGVRDLVAAGRSAELLQALGLR